MSRTLEHGSAAREAEVPTRDRSGLLAAGAMFGVLIASSRCVVPLLLVTLGVSGAWIGNLAALQPYKPYFLMITGLLLGAGFRHVYSEPKRTCAIPPLQRRDGSARPRRMSAIRHRRSSEGAT